MTQRRYSPLQLSLMGLALIALIGVLVWSNSQRAVGPEPGVVNRATLGDAWPLSIDGGTLHCESDRSVILRANGVSYAVNGTARGQMSARGWRDIRDIAVPDPRFDGGVKELQPLVDRGLALCQ